MPETNVAIIIVAAGSSTRFGTDKLGVLLCGRSVLERAVAALRKPFPDAPLVLVVRGDQVEQVRARWEELAIRVTAGGERRQDSVRNGFAALDAAAAGSGS